MANNKTTYVLQIDAEINSLEKKISTIKGLLSGIMSSDKAPKGINKAFEKLENSLDKIRNKASQPITSKGAFDSLNKDITNVGLSLNTLAKALNSIEDLSEIDKISFLPPDLQQQITKVIESVDQFVAAEERALQETKELIAARKEEARAKEDLAKSEEKLALAQSWQKGSAEKQKAIQKEIDLIEARSEALAKAVAEQEEVNAFYNALDENGNKRDKRKKYAGVPMRPQEAKQKVDKIAKTTLGDDKELTRLKKEYEDATKALKSNDEQVRKATESLERHKVTTQTTTEKVQKLEEQFRSNSAKEQQIAFDQLRASAESLGVSLDGIGTAYSKEDAAQLIQRFNELKLKGLDKIDDVALDAKKALKEFGSEAEKTGNKVHESGDEFAYLEEKVSQVNAFQNRIKDFLGITGAAQLMRSALRDAMQTITELDATMTEMSVVTELTVGDYWDQLPEYSKQASDLGVSVNSAYKAATLYYQQGLKGNEVTKISAETLKMAKIAGLDAADATDKMTAALRGFNMELNETSAQKVSDVYSELAAITAADVDEISTAMTKTASIASSAGMEFETTAAFLSQIIETTRESAETAGTALKTVIARFQELKKAPDEIGEVDGEIVDANAIEGALRKVQVSLRDSSGQFRELDDVFLELSSKWDSLDKNTQRYIATIAAGSRQQSRFIAMMSNYARTQELVTAANSSAGASNKQFEKTMDSLESKIAKLENAWHEFTMGILESDLVKSGVDILTKFLEIINKATTGIGGLGDSFSKIISILAIFKMGSKIFEKLKPAIQNFLTSIVGDFEVSGYKAGQAFAQGVKDGTAGITRESVIQSEKAPTLQERFTSSITTLDQERKTRQSLKKKKGVINSLQAEVDYVDHDKEGIVKANEERLKRMNELRRSKETDKATNLGDYKNGQFRMPEELIGKEAEEYKKLEKEYTKNKKLLSEQAEKKKQLAKLTEEYANEEKAFQEKSGKGWKNLINCVSDAGESVTNIGVGISLLGGIFEQIGLEEFGGALSSIGQFAMIAGTALSSLGPIISLLGNVFTIEGGKIAIAGVTAGISWGWVVGIGAAIALLVVGIVAAAKAIEEASLEKQLEKAQEAAERSAKVAEQAAESYNKLNSALDDLSDKYDSLDELTRGTKEWNDAMQDINSSVLELIDEYPELSKFMQSKKGVLTLDLDDEELQNIVINAKTVAVAAQNAERVANAKARQLEGEIALRDYKKDLADNAFTSTVTSVFEEYIEAEKPKQDFWGRTLQIINSMANAVYGIDPNYAAANTALVSGALAKKTVTEEFTLEGEDLEKLAYALAKGEVYQQDGEYFVSETAENFDELSKIIEDNAPVLEEHGVAIRDLGLKIVESIDAQKSYFQASAENTKALINLSEKLTTEQTENAYDYIDSLLTGTDYERFYNEELEKAKTEGYSIQELITELYGSDAKWDSEAKTITNSSGEVLAENITKEDLDSFQANQKATERFIAAGEAAYDMVEKVKNLVNDKYVQDSTVEKLFSDAGGFNLTKKDLNQLTSSGFVDEEATNVLYWNLTEEQRDLFGSLDAFREYINSAVRGASNAFEDAGEILEGIGIEGKMFQEVSAGAAKNLSLLTTSLEQGVWDDTTTEETESFVDAFNNIMSGLETDVQKEDFAREVAILQQDPDNREKWEGLIDVLSSYGVPVSDELKDFVDTAISSSNATYSDSWLKKMGVSDSLISYYRAAISKGDDKTVENFHKTFKEWKKDYDLAQNEGQAAFHDLVTQVADKLVEGYEKQIEEQQNLADAIAEANDQLANKMQNIIDTNRQERANEKTEQEISDKYSEMAYLSQDTSGGNSLDILQLEKEIAEAEQNYEDTLIDQKLQEFSDANTRAEEQRERQIALAESQLQAYQNSGTVYKDAKLKVQEAITAIQNGNDLESTELGKLLSLDTFATDWERASFFTELNSIISKIIGGEDGKEGASVDEITENAIASAQEIINTNEIKELDDTQIRDAYTKYVATLTGSGYSADTAISFEDFQSKLSVHTGSPSTSASNDGIKTPAFFQRIGEILNGSRSVIKEGISSLSSHMVGAFGQNNTESSGTEIAAKEDTGLLSQEALDFAAENAQNLSPMEAFGGVAVPGSVEGINPYKAGEWFNSVVNNKEDKRVQLGAQVQGDRLKQQLDHIYEETGNSSTPFVVLRGTAFGAPDVGQGAEDKFYLRQNAGTWWKVRDQGAKTDDGDDRPTGQVNAALDYLNSKADDKKYSKFITGGLADYTGPAWLDGTPSKPEYVLNAVQTERFFALIDVLESFDSEVGKKEKASGDNYFDIEINVEKLENDYDVEQVANKIRSMIYDDATYRNVNAINLIR